MVALHKFSNNHFDDAVIGSSPLMMIKAIQLAKSGRRVILIDRNKNLGGNWQTSKIKNNGKVDKVEVACHLIEFFPGIYDLLEKYSGTSFVILKPQPIRVFYKTIKLNYLSNFLLIITGFRLIIGSIKSYIDLWRGFTKDYNKIINFKIKLNTYINYQVKNIFQNNKIKGPLDGFVTFIDKLYDKALNENVYFLNMDVRKLKLKKSKWHIIGENKNLIYSKKIHITTSTNLKFISPGNFTADVIKFKQKKSVIVDVMNTDIKLTQTYIAFWNDPLISRISKVDMPSPIKSFQRFLVEIKEVKSIKFLDLRKAIFQYMVNIELVFKKAKIKIIDIVKCEYVENINQLPSGKLDYNLWTYHSAGNLAAGLACWKNE
jgi:hypothetical protein